MQLLTNAELYNFATLTNYFFNVIEYNVFCGKDKSYYDHRTEIS